MSDRHLVSLIRVLGARAFILAAGSALMILMARLLSPGDFGDYQLLLSVSALLAVVSDWGMSHALPRFLAEYRTRFPDRVRPALMAGLRLKLAALAIGIVLLAVFRSPLIAALSLDNVAAYWPFAVVILLGFSLHEYLLKVMEGLERFGGHPIVSVTKNTLDLTLSCALVLSGWGLTGALVGKVAATYVAVAIGGAWVWRRAVRWLPSPGETPSGLGASLMHYAGWLVMIDVGDRVFMNVDRIVINHYLDATLVGFYSVPARLALIASTLGLSVATVVGPAIGRSPERGGRLLGSSLRLLSVIYVWLGVLVFCFADEIVRILFGSEYLGAVPSLRVFAVVIPLMGVSPVLSLTLNYLGKARRRVVFIGAAALATVIGNILLVPRLEIVGSAVAMLFGQIIYVASQFGFVAGSMDLRASRAARPLAAILAGGLVFAAVLWGVRERTTSLWWPAIAAVLFTVPYAAGLIRLGVVRVREIQGLLSLVRR